jgi:hypothetical protein
MNNLIGWRRNNGEHVCHYFKKDNSDSNADSISLCERFYAFRTELVFPGPGMFFCEECKNKAEELKSK